jgi:steroid delta-isomerase-like uncharacterized protein
MAGTRAPRAERLEALTRRWVEAWRPGGLAILDELHAPGFVDRSPGGRGADQAAFKQGVVAMLAAFPDLEPRVEDVVVDEARGKTAVRWSARGTQRGPYLGRPSTGRIIEFRGLELLRFEGERIAERWGEWDGLDLLAQLGG